MKRFSIFSENVTYKKDKTVKGRYWAYHGNVSLGSIQNVRGTNKYILKLKGQRASNPIDGNLVREYVKDYLKSTGI